MSSRLIPWCLAATGFLAALCAFSWQGDLRARSQRAPRLVAGGQSAISSEAPAAASAEPQSGVPTMTLPLPPATQPEPDPDVQSVPDDAPTVDDLPARRGESDPPADE